VYKYTLAESVRYCSYSSVASEGSVISKKNVANV